jgi:ATP-dependent RNA helicase RhlB
VASWEKLPLLLGLLERDRWERTLIFVNRKTTAAELVSALNANGLPVAVLAGNVRQEKRLRILKEFKEGKWPVLIATDVASRGLHIDAVTHVINYDLPQDPEDYVHRVGRTARAGAEGDAISFADEEYVFSLDSIEKLIGRKIPAEVADPALYRTIVGGRRAPHPVRRPRPAPAHAAPKPAEISYGRSRGKARR